LFSINIGDLQVRLEEDMAGGMHTSWFAMATLLMLSGCSWMLAEGQTCSLSGIYLFNSARS